MEFLRDNYVWIIIAAIIIIMTLIGYIAEKTNYKTNKGRKENLPKKGFDENINENDEIIEERVNEIPDEYNSEIENNEISSTDMYNFDEDSNDEVDYKEESSPISDNVDELKPLEDLETHSQLESSTDLDSSNIEEPIPDNEVKDSENDDNNLEIELPNIETLNEEIKDVIDEEDVWKF